MNFEQTGFPSQPVGTSSCCFGYAQHFSKVHKKKELFVIHSKYL